ncbi:MAG: hypothetical protein V3U92_10805 [Cellulophaga sp.]
MKKSVSFLKWYLTKVPKGTSPALALRFSSSFFVSFKTTVSLSLSAIDFGFLQALTDSIGVLTLVFDFCKVFLLLILNADKSFLFGIIFFYKK